MFKALTDTDATAKFWFGNAATSDWKVGSPIEFHREGKLILQGKILENDAPRRLSYTFHAMHEPQTAKSRPRASYSISKSRRTRSSSSVTHDDFVEGSKVFEASSKAGRSCCRTSRATWS